MEEWRKKMWYVLLFCDPMDCSTSGFSVLHFLLEFAQTHVNWVGDAIQPSYPRLPSSPPALNLSQHQIFSSESALRIRWPKYRSFSFSISRSIEYSGLISFRIDWFDLFAVQGTFKSILQHHNSKASFPQHSAFLIVLLSYPYLTTGKTIVWLYGHLSAKRCLCFWIHWLYLSSSLFQETSVF